MNKPLPDGGFSLDEKTRDTYRKFDDQIRELDEDFEVDGVTFSAPEHFGDLAVHLDKDELKTLQDKSRIFWT